MPKPLTSGLIQLIDGAERFRLLFIGDTMSEQPIELNASMPQLCTMSNYTSAFEAYYGLITERAVGGNLFGDVLYYAKEGKMRRLFNQTKYTLEICQKVRDFIIAMNYTANDYLNSTALREMGELKNRLIALAKSKESAEDPLGW
jgi:hypothetical protein